MIGRIDGFRLMARSRTALLFATALAAAGCAPPGDAVEASLVSLAATVAAATGALLLGRVWARRRRRRTRQLQQLAEQRAELAEAQAIAQLGSFTWDGSGDVLYCSDALSRIYGFEEQPATVPIAMGMWERLIHPDDRERVLAGFIEAVFTGQPFAAEYRIVRDDGCSREVSTRARPSPGHGHAGRWLGTTQDVTEQKQVESALRRSEERVQEILRHERALRRASEFLASSRSVDLHAVLRELGEATGADRAYMFRLRRSGDALLMDNTHEWCAAGVPSVIARMQGVNCAALPWWGTRLQAGGPIIINSLAELPAEAAAERALLESQQVKALTAVPITDSDRRVLGFLGFDYVRNERVGPGEDRQMLPIAAEMLAGYLARISAEHEIVRREAIMRAVSFTAEHFLRSGAWQSEVSRALAEIGAAAGASRAYLFENLTGADGEVRISQRAEWTAHGIAPQIDNPELQEACLADVGLQRWMQAFQRGDAVHVLVDELPAHERPHLQAQDIHRLMAIPIMVGGQWWGILGIDDCSGECEWSGTELDVLTTAARIIAAAVERARSETTLRESEERFRQMASAIRDTFWLVKLDGSEVLYMSPGYEEIWGRSREELQIDPYAWTDAMMPEDRASLAMLMERNTAGIGDGLDNREFRITRPDGTIRWIHSRSFLIRDEDGRPWRVGGVSSDITQKKQMEEELRRANRLEAIGHLAAGVAHEINTPIQYVGDNVRFLDESLEDLKHALSLYATAVDAARSGTLSVEEADATAAAILSLDLDYVVGEAPRAIAQALEGVSRVSDIVRAMREFSHPGTTQKLPADLNHAIRSTATVARSEWKYVADLVLDLDPDLPAVTCLIGDLNQAVLNLILNAAHAIADAAAMLPGRGPGTITVATRMDGDFVEISVRDTGIGIPAEIRPRIFDPFFTTKEVGRGTGQGLTFVHSIIVDKHDGAIAFETEPGAGTTFTLRIPRRPAELVAA